MQVVSEAPELLTTEEVARRLRVSRSTVSRWASDGELRVVRIGGVLRFHAADIEALIHATQADPPVDAAVG